MVVGGMAPLFLLWAMRGNGIIPDWQFRLACGAVAVIPNVFLWWLIRSRRERDLGTSFKIGSFDDRREGVLTYIIAILLPFYGASLETRSDVYSAFGVLLFIVVVFLHLDLQYVNLFFVISGYYLYFVRSNEGMEASVPKSGAILITKRDYLKIGQTLSVSELSSGVFVERV